MTVCSPDESVCRVTPFQGDRAINPTIEPLFEKLGSLCSLPQVAQQIIQVCEDEDSDAEDLLSVIAEDVAVSTRLLKAVNSAYYGVREGVADLKTAITVLGVNGVRNVALTVSIGEQFSTQSPVGALEPNRLWDHSVCVAAVSRIVAKKTRSAPPEEAYLAGLLHDLGLLFIMQHLSQLATRVLARCEGGSTLCEAERFVLAFDHAQLGAYVAWRSMFPDRLVLAIDYHHDPLSCPEEGRPLACVVSVANYLATRYGRGSIAGRRLPAPTKELLEPLGLDLEGLRDVWSELPETVAQVSELARV